MVILLCWQFGKSLRRARSRLGRLLDAVLGWRVCFERAEQITGDGGYLVNGSYEGDFIGF